MTSGFVSGALFLGYALSSLFFLRFWRDSRDRLFGMFALAFAMLATQRLLLGLALGREAFELLYYGLRLLAFLVIIVAIVDKNRARG